jgi:hypothetical protein
MGAGLIGGMLGLFCGVAVGFGLFLLSKMYVDHMPQFDVIRNDGLLYSLFMKFGFVIAMIAPTWIGWSLGVAVFGGK